MNTKQKTLLGIFLGMFVVPEILFSFIISSVLFLFGINFPFILGQFINPQIFTDNQNITFLFIGIEWLGILGLIFQNTKFNKTKSKTILTIVLSLLLIFLTLVFYTAYYMRHGIGF